MTTFVTAFLDLGEDRSKDKSLDVCFSHFSNLCSIEIPLVVFISPVYMDRCKQASHITYIPIELSELETYKEVVKANPKLPESRTPHHDTRNFMILMNAKIEFIQKAIVANPFQSSHFAWIDFSICHVFRKPAETLDYLRMLSNTALAKRCLTFPGCWCLNTGSAYLQEAINWRFCGGFFLGDMKSLLDMYTLYRNVFPAYLKLYGTLVWEVNVWHRMELDGWKCTWYKADHNDSIVKIPSSFFYTVASLTTIPSRITTSCRTTIDSLLNQVDHIYLSIAKFYTRFQVEGTIPSYLQEEPYKSKVTVILCEDKGPATKYLGALDALSAISPRAWVFVCDDDQVYKSNLLETMKRGIDRLCILQNRYASIQKDTTGGMIHGYVGNLGHASLYKELPQFPLPPCSFHVDDQWMSIYCFMKHIHIRPSGVDSYSDIFGKLEHGHECIGSDSLFSLGSRTAKANQLAEYFKVRFASEGRIELCGSSS